MTGIVSLSMEIELGWGDHDTGNLDRLSEGGALERRYLSKLLGLTDDVSIPISFNVVGHLFLDSCSGSHDSPHEEGWFRGDPGTNRLQNGLFYAPDMMSRIRDSETDHEICTHTFSHALFNDISREVCDWELRRAQELHREHVGRPTTSLVPPRHQPPPYDVLRDNGISVVRPAMDNRAKSKLHRFKELLSGPLVHSPLRETGGITETYCTTYPSLTAPSLPSGQGTPHPVFRHLPTTTRQRYHLEKLKRVTEEVAERDSHVHLWCHLFDVSNGPQFEVVGEYLRWLDTFRRDRDLVVAKMEELPRYLREQGRPEPGVSADERRLHRRVVTRREPENAG